MYFSHNLKYLRKMCLMTQDAVAEKIGVRKQAISKYESKTTFPEQENLTKLCELFELDENRMIREDLEKSGYLPSRFKPLNTIISEPEIKYERHPKNNHLDIVSNFDSLELRLAKLEEQLELILKSILEIKSKI